MICTDGKIRCSLQIDEGFLSAPSAVEFPTEGGLTAFMNYYPPKNKASIPHKGSTVALLSAHTALHLLLREAWTSVQRAPP